MYLGLRLQLFQPNEADPWPHPALFIKFMNSLVHPSIILTMTAAYFIVFKSENLTKTYRSLLMVHLFWSFLLELLASSLAVPVIFVPFKAGYCSGIFTYFRISPRFIIMIWFSVIMASMVSILNLFLYRLFSVLKSELLFTKKWLLLAGFLAFYVISISYVALAAFLIYDEDMDRRLVAQEQWGHIPFQIDHRGLIVFARVAKNNFVVVSFIALTSVHGVAALLLGLGTFLIIKRSPSMNEEMQKMHTKLTRSLIIQTFLFIFCLFIPCLIILCGALIFDYLPIAVSNVIVFLLWLSGVADTVALIACAKDYREMVASFCRLVVNCLTCRSSATVDCTPVVYSLQRPLIIEFFPE